METIVYVAAVFMTSLICGLGFRIRGGLWNTIIERHVHWGSTTARLVAWSLPTAVLTTLWYGFAWYLMPIFWVAAWLGCLQGWYHSIDMGRDGGAWFKEFLLTSVRGVLWTLPMSMMFWWMGLMLPAVGVLACGAAMGIWYELGWQTPSTIPGFHRGPELGELYFGLMYGATLAVLALM